MPKNGQITGIATISRLRQPIWFSTVHGLPFADWSGKNARLAIRAYRQAAIAVSRATGEEEVRSALIAFVEVINTLCDIFTLERENVSAAVQQLAALASNPVTPEMA